MPRNVTITFDDGSTHSYQNVPDTVTPDQVEQRAAGEFAGKKVTNIAGDKTAPQALTTNRTPDQIPSHMQNGVQVSDDPKVLLSNYGRNAKPAPGQTYESAGIKYQEPTLSDYADMAKQGGIDLLRTIGRTGRNIAQGAPSLLGMLTDAPAHLYEGLTGNQAPSITKPYQSYAQALDSPALADKTSEERVSSDIQRALAGTAGSMGIAGPLAIPAAGQAPTAQNLIAQSLAANPGQQAASAIGGSAAGGITREMGGGQGAQLAASLIGGTAPGLLQQAGSRLIGQPSDAAKTLRNAGVDTTPGQNNQGGVYSQLEDALQDWPIVGPSIKQAKEQAQNQAREAFLLQGQAPGADLKPTGDLQQTLRNVGESFEPAYDQVSGYPLRLKNGQPVIMNAGADQSLGDAFDKLIANKGILATDETRQTAKGFLDNLLTLPVKNSEDLLAMRSAIRTQARNLSGDSSLQAKGLANILDAADSKVTEAIQSQLPPDLMAKLKPVDAQYAKYKTAVDTMAAAKDRPDGFTFNQASNAASKSAQAALGKDAYAKGGGFMRDIPAAAQSVFKQSPPTGARLIANSIGLPLLPLIAAGTLTKAGRNLAGNNVVNPYLLPGSGLGASLAQALQGAQ